MILSTFAHESIEDVKKEATEPLWHATYLLKDRGECKAIMQRAEAAGYEAIVIVIDTPVMGARDRERRSQPKTVLFQYHPIDYYRFPVTWSDVEWYRAQTKLPLVLKGVMDPDDAEQCLQLGASAIIVSNHGGRNLDTTPATIEMLPAVVERVAGRVPVLIDGGIRRGTDVLKALALGATAVGIGRPYLYGLAVEGADGVKGVVNILRNELEMAMASTGRPTIASINRSVLAPQGLRPTARTWAT
jgi:4-hydroxymandelate oxidase